MINRTLVTQGNTPTVYFDATQRPHDPAGRAQWEEEIAGCVNECLFAVIRNIPAAAGCDASAVREEGRAFMRQATHSYPWSEDGQRVLLRGLGPATADTSPALLQACQQAQELFFAIAQTCLTPAERERTRGETTLASHDPILQVYESWQGSHGLHNDSRQSHLRIPLIGSFLVAKGRNARGLKLWPGYADDAIEIELAPGDLMLMRDSIEVKLGQIRYALTHATMPATGPEDSERIVAIHRAGLFPRSFLDSVHDAGKNLMDIYLESVASTPAVERAPANAT